MSSRSIGAEFEKKVKAALEANGFLVERAWPQFVPLGPGRIISKRHDFFGVADLIAYKPWINSLQSPLGKTFFIQCTAGGDVSAKKLAMIKHGWAGSHRPQVWARDETDKQLVHVYEYVRVAWNAAEPKVWRFKWKDGIPAEVLS